MIVFVPLKRMPLNPNGKIDKPILPFPDTAQAVSAVAQSSSKPSSTEEKMRSLWAGVLPNAPQPIPLDESFFDLGGHSILATRLIFEIRKAFVVEAPLGLIFDQPTIGGLVQAVEALRNADFGLTYKDSDAPSSNGHLAVPSTPSSKPATAVEYGHDYDELVGKLQDSYGPLRVDFNGPLTVFLTGATGFLGAFVLRDLLSRPNVKKVICLVRASDKQKGLERLKEVSTDRGVWDDEWVTEGRL